MELNRWIRSWLGQEPLTKYDKEIVFAQQAEFPLIGAFYGAVRLTLLFFFDLVVQKNEAAAIGSQDVDDAIGFFECGAAGLVHTHAMRWMKGSPRADLLLQRDRDEDTIPEEIADQVTKFFAGMISEWYPEDDVDPKRISRKMEAKRNPSAHELYRDPCTMTFEERRAILDGTPEQREEYLRDLQDACNWHDEHTPDPHGPPSSAQNCAKFVKGTEGTLLPVLFCKHGFGNGKDDKPLIPEGRAFLREDKDRADTLYLDLPRNTHLQSSSDPVRLFASQTNTHDSAICSPPAGLKRYMSSYAAGVNKEFGNNEAEMVGIFDTCVEAAKKQGKGMYSAVTKMFNTVCIPEMISDREICHHLLLMPQYLSTREFSYVSLEPRTRKVKKNAQGTEEEEILCATRFNKWEDRGDEKTHSLGTNLM